METPRSGNESIYVLVRAKKSLFSGDFTPEGRASWPGTMHCSSLGTGFEPPLMRWSHLITRDKGPSANVNSNPLDALAYAPLQHPAERVMGRRYFVLAVPLKYWPPCLDRFSHSASYRPFFSSTSYYQPL